MFLAYDKFPASDIVSSGFNLAKLSTVYILTFSYRVKLF